ncbi:MAG TPA: MBL fold metallo-hydrolase [Longimicrobiales bacterium]|nr:MBL fold metallo-hydrolase [Longimicrobiales bacterium]
MRPRSPLVGLLLAVALAVGACAAPRAQVTSGSPERLRIHFLDVGQGDAVLIEAPAGRHVLIDAGPGSAIVGQLRELGVDTIDLFIATHNHADHIGGAAAVLTAFPVRFFMDNGVPHTTATYRNMLEAVAARDVPLLEPEARSITVGDVVLEILPPPGDPALDHNDNSIGVVLAYGEFRATFAGDAEDHLWRHWLAEIPEAIPEGVAVHKASHHGSRNGDSREALRRVRPRLVVISAAAENLYGHPHAEALALYREVGAAVLFTGSVGTVTVEARTDGDFEVRTSR